MFLFSVMIDSNLLIPALITQMFYLPAELVTPTGISTTEAKAENGTQPVKVEDTSLFCIFLLINSLCFISSKIYFFV